MRIKILFLFFYLALIFSSCISNNEKPSGKKVRVNFDWISIPAGNYILGDSSSFINPIHEAHTNGFYITPNEITNSQFKEFIDATHYVTTAEKYKNARTFYVGLGEFEWVDDSTANWKFPFGKANGGIENKMDYPVTCISFLDIQKFCEWAEVRLPTLDEWEIACRANTRTKYFFGNDSTLIHEYANIWKNRRHDTLTNPDENLFHSKGGIFKPNPWGLYDMYGNNFEFCSDHYTQVKNKKKVACARGGSWWCSKNSCNFFNSVDIGSVSKFASFSNHGFRVVKK